jgi:exonuclease SbcD
MTWIVAREVSPLRILHTADWHLGDRLGRIDRTDDLRRAVERIATYCASERVDVLLVAGDLFSEQAGPEGLRDAVRHLQEVFQPFLRDGGTILALTGNHDKESFCQTLRHAMSLASPIPTEPGSLCQAGRLYLATEPTLLRLADRSADGAVQFLLMPYPTPARYLADEAGQRYQSLEQKNRHLMAAFTARLKAIRRSPAYELALPSVLAAHVTVRGSRLPTLFRLTEEEDVIVSEGDIPDDFAYVALGHIHRPQFLHGLPHVRYCGSVERLDLGESNDDKSCVLVDIGTEGRRGDPVILPLEATPIYVVQVTSPRDQLDALRTQYANAERDLVRLECTYTAGVDNREEALRELDRIFPRWYDRKINETNALNGTLVTDEPGQGKSFADTVRDFLGRELANHPEDVRTAVLVKAEALLAEMRDE